MDDFLSITPDTGGAAAAIYALFGVLFITGAVLDAFAVFTGRMRSLAGPYRVNRLRTRPWSLLDAAWLFLVLATGYAMLCAAAALAPQTVPSDRGTVAVVMLLVRTLCLPAMGMGAILFVLRAKGLSFRAAFGADGRAAADDIRHGLLFYAMAMPVVGFYSIVYVAGLRWAGYPTNAPQEVVRFMLNPRQPLAAQLYLAALAVLVAPLSEELLFRGVLLPLAARHMRLPLAICFVSFVFAAMHGHVPSMMPLFLIAVAFSLGYLHSGSIAVPIVMHATFNAFSLAAMLLLRGTGN